MDPNTWQAYNRKHRSSGKRSMRVTIWTSGKLGMNDVAWHAMGSPKWVRLFYSETPRRIALVPVPEKVPGAAKVQKRADYQGAACTVIGFCRQFNIPLETALTFEPDAPTPDRALILDLAAAGMRPTGNSSRL